MFAQLFSALTDRFKALFTTSAALDLEAQFIARDAERRAELHRQADRYEGEGLHGIAQQLRQRADEVSVQRPLASVLPAIEHVTGNGASSTPLLPAPVAEDPNHVAALVPTKTKKKGR